jgi:hypothetical protein
MTGDTITSRLNRIEIKADAASSAASAAAAAASAAAASAGAAAAAAGNAASSAAASAINASTVAASTATQIENLKVAIIGGGALLPDDRGALGRVEEKFDKWVLDAAEREQRGWQRQVSNRTFVISLVSIGVLFAGVIAGIVVR